MPHFRILQIEASKLNKKKFISLFHPDVIMLLFIVTEKFTLCVVKDINIKTRRISQKTTDGRNKNKKNINRITIKSF